MLEMIDLGPALYVTSTVSVPETGSFSYGRDWSEMTCLWLWPNDNSSIPTIPRPRKIVLRPLPRLYTSNMISSVVTPTSL